MSEGKPRRVTLLQLVLPVVLLGALLKFTQNPSPRYWHQPDSSQRSSVDAASTEVPPDLGSKFELVGYFSNGKVFRGLTYCVTDPNMQNIQDFCRDERERHSQVLLIKIHFFDSWEHTPDVSEEYFFPDSCQPYLVADYFSRSLNDKGEGLQFHKSIPDRPIQSGK